MMWRISRLGSLFFVLQVVVAICCSADTHHCPDAGRCECAGICYPPAHVLGHSGYGNHTSDTSLAGVWGGRLPRRYDLGLAHTLPHARRYFCVRHLCASAALIISLSNKYSSLSVGPSIHPAHSCWLLGLAVWAVLQCVSGTLESFLNGASIMRFQIGTHCALGVAYLVAKVWSVRHYGIVAMPWATGLTLLRTANHVA